MLWLIFSAISLIYYAVVRFVAQEQQLTIVWLVLAVLFLIPFFFKKYRKSHPEYKRMPLWLRTFWTTSVLLFLIMNTVVGVRILGDMLSVPEKDLAFIVVLNQSDLAGETYEEWSARLDEAVFYLHANPETKVVVSGGWDEQKGYSQAHTMYRYLQMNGIDGRRVYWETRSSNTKENIEYALSICHGDEQPVGIVASDYSMYRISRIARNLGMTQVEPIPAETTLWLYPHRVVQELLQVVRDKFLGI